MTISQKAVASVLNFDISVKVSPFVDRSKTAGKIIIIELNPAKIEVIK